MTKTLISQQRPFTIEQPPASSLRPPSFPWACVTGADFGRSNAWARRQPINPINAAARSQVSGLKSQVSAK